MMFSATANYECVSKMSMRTRLFLLDRLYSDLLVSNEDTLSLVRFWRPQLAHLGSKQSKTLFVIAAKHNLCWRRHLRLDVGRYRDINDVTVSELHVESLPTATIHRPSWVLLEYRAVTNADEVQGNSEALGHTNDRVIDQGTRRPPHSALFLSLCILHSDIEKVRLREGKPYEGIERDGGSAERARHGNGGGCRSEGNILRNVDGCLANV